MALEWSVVSTGVLGESLMLVARLGLIMLITPHRLVFVSFLTFVRRKDIHRFSERDPALWNLSEEEIQRRRALFWELYSWDAFKVGGEPQILFRVIL